MRNYRVQVYTSARVMPFIDVRHAAMVPQETSLCNGRVNVFDRLPLMTHKRISPGA